MTPRLLISTLVFASACAGQSDDAPRDPYGQVARCLPQLLVPAALDVTPWWQWRGPRGLVDFEGRVKGAKQDCQRHGPLKDWRDEQGRPCGADLTSEPGQVASDEEARAMGEIAVRELGAELAIIDFEALRSSLRSWLPTGPTRPGRMAQAAPAEVLDHILRVVQPSALLAAPSWSREPEAVLGLLLELLSERPELWDPRVARFAEVFIAGQRPHSRYLARQILARRPSGSGG